MTLPNDEVELILLRFYLPNSNLIYFIDPKLLFDITNVFMTSEPEWEYSIFCDMFIVKKVYFDMVRGNIWNYAYLF